MTAPAQPAAAVVAELGFVLSLSDPDLFAAWLYETATGTAPR